MIILHHNIASDVKNKIAREGPPLPLKKGLRVETHVHSPIVKARSLKKIDH